jgi:hypothetical protein
MSFLTFLSKASEREGFEKDTRGGESVFMSKALPGLRQKDIRELTSVFFKPIDMTSFRHKRHKRQYPRPFLVSVRRTDTRPETRRLENRPSCRQITSNPMDNSRELASMLRRANKIAIRQRPPALELAVINAGDEMPPPSPWRLTIQVEPKRTVSPASST